MLPGLLEPWLFDTSIIWMQNFPIVNSNTECQNVLIIEEKLDELMATDRFYTEHYRSRRSTTVAKSWKILKENGRHRWVSLIRTNSLIWTLLKSTTTEDVWRMHCTLYAVLRKDKSHQIPSQLLRHVYHFTFRMVILGKKNEESTSHGGNTS